MSEDYGSVPSEQAIAAEHAELATEDAAYLLGGLEPAEQDRFERHLLYCERCRESIDQLAELPRLLGTVRLDDLVEAGDQVDPVPETLLPGLFAQIATVRRRRLRRAVLAGFAAACVLAAFAGLGGWWWTDSHRAHPVALSAVGPNRGAVHAEVTLTGSGSVPRIKLECGYRSPAGLSYPAGSAIGYRMVVVNRLGQVRELGSWSARSGEEVELVRDSPWSRQNLSRIEVTDDQGVPVLQLSL